MPDLNPSERLAEIEARVEAATEGPWEALDAEGDEANVVPWVGKTRDDGQIDAIADECAPADAEFIAHARSDIPWLLELVREQQRKLDIALRVMNRDIEALYEEALADSGEASE